jgi:hypothetical protein
MAPSTGPAVIDYTVVVTDGRGCTDSDTVTVTVDTCTSLSNVLGLGSSTIFPNPSNGNFMVDVKLQKNVKNASISVVTLEGKVVYTRTLAPSQMRIKEEIKLSGMSKGNYVVQIGLDDSVLIHQLIIQ